MKKVCLLFLLACCFGPSFLFIKVAICEVSPCTLATLRVGIAALFLYLVLRLKKGEIKPWRHLWPHFLVVGACSCTLPFSLIGYGEYYVSSGLAGMINGSIPVFTALIAHFVTKDERITRKTALGICLGLLGLGLIFFPHMSGGNEGNQLGILAITASSLFYAIGMVYSKKYLNHLPHLVGPIWQLIAATVIGLFLSLVFENPLQQLSSSLSQKTVFAMMSLSFIGTFSAFIIYYQIIRIASASYLSFVALLFPLVAVGLGALFFKEQLTWNSYLGGFLILLGLVTTHRFPSVRGYLKISQFEGQ